MGPSSGVRVLLAVFTARLVLAQQQCYFDAGADFRAPADVVPCDGSGQSACCKLGDTCLSGNACYDQQTGNTYQYGCTDITYQDATCPFKCGWNSTLSPWTALEFCNDLSDVTDTWVCQSPESCGCEWQGSWDLLVLAPRQCREMGSEARVALYAPSALIPYASLPSTVGGSTGYFQTTTIDGTLTWTTTPINGYTPSSIGPYTTYNPPAQKIIQLDANGIPSSATLAPAHRLSSSAAPSQNTHITYNPSLLPPTSRGATATATSTPDTSARVITTTAKGSVKTITASAPPQTNLKSANPAAAASSSAPAPSPVPLSTGAKAGIGVGIALGIILLAALLAFMLLRRRRRRNRSKSLPTSDPDYPEPSVDEKRTGRPVLVPVAEAPADEYYDPHHSKGSSSYDPHWSGGSWQPSLAGAGGMVHEASYSREEEERLREEMKGRAVELESLNQGQQQPVHEMESPPLGAVRSGGEGGMSRKPVGGGGGETWRNYR